MTILSAAIKAIPDDIVEAARLDGVGGLQMFRYITVPSIRPSLIVVLTTISIATLKVFDIVRTMTGGNFDTSVLAYEFYTQSFRSDNQRARCGAGRAAVRPGDPDHRLQRPSDAKAGGTMSRRDRPSNVAARPTPIDAEETASPQRRSKSAHLAVGLGPAIVIAVLWTIPTLGLLITSFRPERRHQDAAAGGRSSRTRASRWTTTRPCCTAATPTWRRTS